MRAAVLILVCALPSGLLAQEDDIEVDAGARIEAGKQRIQKIDQAAKKAPPKQQEKLQQQRATEVKGIEELAAANPKSPKINLSGAQALVDVNEPAHGLPFANKAVELAPQNPQARVVRGNANFALGNYQAAAEDARTALSFDPQNQSAKALLKLSERRLEGIGSPVRIVKPSFQDPGGENAGERSHGSASEKPAERFSAGTESTTPSPIARRDEAAAQRAKAGELLKEAHAKLRLGDPDGASRLAHKATLLAPSDADVRAEAAFVRLKARDVHGALEDSALAVGLGPKPPAEAFLIEASAAAALGDYPRVLAAIEQAAKIAPRYAALRDLSLRAPSDALVRAIDTALSAHFGPAYESALARLDEGRAPSPPEIPPAARVARQALSAAGLALALAAGALWLRLRRAAG